ncbi:TPA: non-ribosomal peptide synthetase, partial [Streptococcus equi subsp. equi]|nr:non-ribosomal peptide synthetase [Streptococcus equi subsp. equi]
KGLSSIQVMQLSGKLKKTGIKISFAKLMEEPNLSKWYELIDKSRVKSDKNIESSIIQSDESKFDLTDVQYSYLIGREDDQILGGVGCHAYLEIDGENIDEDKLKEAWNKLQYRHPMLRTKFTKDGKQEILYKPYSEEIEVFDLSDLDEETLHLKLVEIREQKSHRKLNVNQGQVAGVALAKFSDEKSRIFFDVDLLVSDVMSMSIMIKELAELYSGVELDNLNEYTFKDYMQNGIGESINDADKEFWEQKINSFEIERPNLPLRKQPEQIKETKFTRRKRIIKKSEWETIKDIAASYRSTPSMVLLTAYALVLERWCNQDKFFINIPLFNRDLENENLKEMVADFT